MPHKVQFNQEVFKIDRKPKREFVIGQKVFHPIYGVGTVTKKKSGGIIPGQKDKLSVINFEHKRMQLMTSSYGGSMISDMISKSDLPRVMNILQKQEFKTDKYPSNGYERYQYIMDELKSGDVYDVVRLIRDLAKIMQNKRLGNKEKKLFRQIKEGFCDILSDVGDISLEEAEALLSKEL